MTMGTAASRAIRKAALIGVVVFGLAALWATPAPAATGVRDAVFVGNNWDGTADVIDPHGNFRRVARINIIPDIQRADDGDLHQPGAPGLLPGDQAGSWAKATTSSSTTCTRPPTGGF